MAVLNKGIVGFSEYIKKDRLEPILVVIPFLEYREFSLDYEKRPSSDSVTTGGGLVWEKMRIYDGKPKKRVLLF